MVLEVGASIDAYRNLNFRHLKIEFSMLEIWFTLASPNSVTDINRNPYFD